MAHTSVVSLTLASVWPTTALLAAARRLPTKEDVGMSSSVTNRPAAAGQMPITRTSRAQTTRICGTGGVVTATLGCTVHVPASICNPCAACIRNWLHTAEVSDRRRMYLQRGRPEDVHEQWQPPQFVRVIALQVDDRPRSEYGAGGGVQAQGLVVQHADHLGLQQPGISATASGA